MMLIILSFLLILLLCLAIVMTVLYAKLFIGQNIRICGSKECLRSAANLAASIDTTADPCEDFYQYSCGNWAVEHPRPAGYKSHSWFQYKKIKMFSMVSDFLTRNISGLPKPVRQAKDMYAACMDTENLDKLGLEPVMQILESLTLPPYPTYVNVSKDFDYDTYNFDWIETVIKIKTMLGMDVLFGVNIMPDNKNSSVYRLNMGMPVTTNRFPSIHDEEKKRWRKERKYFILPTTEREFDETFYGNDDLRSKSTKRDDDYEKRSIIYNNSVLKLFKIFVKESGVLKSADINERELVLLLWEYSYIVRDIVEIPLSFNTDDNLYANKLQYTVNELQNHTDMIVESNNATAVPIWRRYLEGVFNISDIELNFENDKIQVSKRDLEYLSGMATVIAKTPPGRIELYIWLTVVEEMIAHTTTNLVSLHERIATVMEKSIYTGPAARSRGCVNTVNVLMGMAVSYAFVDPHFVTVTKPKIQTMVHEIKNALADLVGEAKWMDDESKLVSYQKLIEMKSYIGYQDWFLDDSHLEEYYEGIEVTANTHLANIVNVLHVKFRKTLNKFRERNNFTWTTEPTDVNGYYDNQDNIIFLPLAMTQHPFFDLGLDSLNYGSMGTVLGHEITHGFRPDIAREYDENGNYLSWWSNETVESFFNMAQCFIDQFSKFYVPEIDEYVNGEKTLYENIADSAGMKEALAALQHHLRTHGPEPKLPGFEHMTSEQLFFLSVGNYWCGIATEDSLQEDIEDVHTPAKFRLKGALQNNEQFAKAWRCAPGSTMNPRTRCIIF